MLLCRNLLAVLEKGEWHRTCCRIAAPPTTEFIVANPSAPQFSEPAFWRRTLYMILFVIGYSIAELVVGLVVVVQFVVVLFTGTANEPLLRFGNGLATWVRQVFRFLTFNTETMPFPFSDWPDESADGGRWRARSTPAESTAADDPAAASVEAAAAAPAASDRGPPAGSDR
jgi:hypothetical protein